MTVRDHLQARVNDLCVQVGDALGVAAYLFGLLYARFYNADVKVCLNLAVRHERRLHPFVYSGFKAPQRVSGESALRGYRGRAAYHRRKQKSGNDKRHISDYML